MDNQMHSLTIAGKTYRSRLLVGTGKYKDFAETRAAIDASGAEIVTVAIRRVNIGQNPGEPNLLDALNDALGLDLQMDDPTVMTMLVTFEEDGSYHMDYDAKALREELNALEDALCEKYPDQEALLKQAFAGLQLDVDGSSGTYTASNGILYLTQSGEDWEDILYYSVEDNKLYLTPPQDEESGDWGGMFGSEYPMVFERVD